MIKIKRLIVNADDLALHPLVNRAVFRAHREGIVTSATILAGGTAFSDAVNSLKDHPSLGVGIHLCLVDQKPVTDPQKIPSLVNFEGRLWKDYSVFLKRYLSGRINKSEVRIELESQIKKALDRGIQLTHMDSHQHLHILPGLTPIFAEIGRKYGMKKVRIPRESISLPEKSSSKVRNLQGWIVARLAEKSRRVFYQAGLSSTDNFFGFSTGGNMSKETWLKLIPALLPGITEVMVHPGEENSTLKSATGVSYHWVEETAALTDPEILSLLEKEGIQRIHYGDLD